MQGWKRYPFWLPKPPQVESKRPLGRLLAPPNYSTLVKASKEEAKKCPKGRQEPPTPSPNPPKTLPKPLQNRLKIACEKYVIFWTIFFTIFCDFGLQNHLFFNDLLMHASVQFSLIFGTLSPSQSISFGRMFDTF